MENSIEEAIKILEEFKTHRYAMLLIKYEDRNKANRKLDQAIEHILSDYKRVLKENEHKTEKIENQKSELAILNDKQKDFNKLQNTLKSYKGQFRRQEKENEKLRKQLNEENKRCMMLAIEKQDYFEKYRYHLQQNESLTKEFSNVIPILKIKDKIEELNNNRQYLSQFKDYKEKNYTNEEVINNCVEVLQELLESE